MLTTTQLIAFLIPTLALNLTPGPDMLFVVSQSLLGGPKAAFKAAAGLWLGYLLHIALVGLGLAAIFSRHPEAIQVMKALGGAYLLYLGTKLLLTRQAKMKTSGPKEKSPLLKGILVSALNPKVAIFFLAFLPQFIHPGHASPTLQMIALGFLFSLTSTVVNSSAGLLAHLLKNRRANERFFSVERLCGIALLGMAARLALAR